jgi:hypothetical protein
MDKKYQVTPVGMLLLELGDEEKVQNLCKAFAEYMQKIDVNAIVITKKGKVKFIKVHRRK